MTAACFGGYLTIRQGNDQVLFGNKLQTIAESFIFTAIGKFVSLAVVKINLEQVWWTSLTLRRNISD